MGFRPRNEVKTFHKFSTTRFCLLLRIHRWHFNHIIFREATSRTSQAAVRMTIETLGDSKSSKVCAWQDRSLIYGIQDFGSGNATSTIRKPPLGSTRSQKQPSSYNNVTGKSPLDMVSRNRHNVRRSKESPGRSRLPRTSQSWSETYIGMRCFRPRLRGRSTPRKRPWMAATGILLETKYSAFSRELIAVKAAIKHFRSIPFTSR